MDLIGLDGLSWIAIFDIISGAMGRHLQNLLVI